MAKPFVIVTLDHEGSIASVGFTADVKVEIVHAPDPHDPDQRDWIIAPKVPKGAALNVVYRPFLWRRKRK